MPQQTTTVTGQQSIPTELMPYFTGTGGVAGLLPKAQEIFSKGYAEQYGDPLTAAGLAGTGRIAPLSAMQQQVGTELGTMATPTQFGMGAGSRRRRRCYWYGVRYFGRHDKCQPTWSVYVSVHAKRP